MMPEASVSFTVVIPLFNKERYIARAVQSVLDQNISSFELLIVDDGSTDESYLIAARFADRRIKIIRQANSGEGAARNAGIERSTHRWVAFLDADDYWYPDHLETISSIIAICPEAALVSTQLVHAYEGKQLPPKNDGVADARYIDFFEELNNSPGLVSSSSAAIDTYATGKANLFPNYPRGADVACWAKIAALHRVAVTGKQTAIYFRGTGGVIDNLEASGGRYSKQISSLADISPAVAVAWSDLIPPGNMRTSAGKFATTATLKYIRGAAHLRKYDYAIKAANIAAKYNSIFLAVKICLEILKANPWLHNGVSAARKFYRSMLRLGV